MVSYLHLLLWLLTLLMHRVLILVIVEDGLVQSSNIVMTLGDHVLILIVVEDGLVHETRLYTKSLLGS